MATTGLAEVFPVTAGLNNFHEVRRIAPNELEGCSPSALTGQIELIAVRGLPWLMISATVLVFHFIIVETTRSSSCNTQWARR